MKIRMTKCRFCGGTEFITGYQNFQGAVYSSESLMRSVSLYHTICRNCGSVVRSFVNDPEKLLRKKDRKTTSQGEE